MKSRVSRSRLTEPGGHTDFELVKARLNRSHCAPRMPTDDRHVWLPLVARPDAAGPELGQDLIAHISSIIATA